MTKLILASNSPRRKKILTDLGLDFEVIPSNYDEKLETDNFSYDLIEDLATQKACDVVRRLGHNEIVLEKDIVFVGVMSKIEIWSKEHWDENDDFDNVDEIAEHMSELGLSY